MRYVEWLDDEGCKRLSMLRDSDSDDMARQGVPVRTIDVDEIDWIAVKRELHNEMVERRLLTWKDVQQKGGLRGLVALTLQRELIRLLKTLEKETQHE